MNEMNRQAILFLSDKSTEWIVNNYTTIRKSVSGNSEAFFLYHQKNNNLPEVIKNGKHFVFTNDILTELNYQPIENNLVPGSNHFPLLKFYLENLHYDYYWNIEDDVCFHGNWKYLFDSFKDCDADFISSHIATYPEEPNWYWWFSLTSEHDPIPLEKRIRSFNPIYRISNRALALLHQSLLDGWSGHHEVLIPTLLFHQNYKIIDIGGTGSFVPEGFENKFYTHESLSHLPIEMGDVENRIYHPIKEKKKINLEALKKYCVISAVGKNSLHREWIKESPDFDLHLIIYDNSYNKFYDDTDFIAYQKGYKFKLVYDYLVKNPVYLEKYDYFFIPDDDIQIDAVNIAWLFNYMESYKLSIAQPALSDSYYTYEHTIKRRSTLLRYSNFVEMMTPCFSREALQKVMFTFNENNSGWGIEFHWSEIIGFSGNEMAIIDDIDAIHTRPIQSFNPENLNELTGYIEKYKLNREIREFGCIPNENYKLSEGANWKPILTETGKMKRVERRLEMIANTLLQRIQTVQGVGLLEGRTGISLFFFNYYRLTGKRKYLDIANAIFESIYGNIPVLVHNFTFIDGLPGISWFVEYLARHNYIEDNTDEVLEEICDTLNKVDICSLSDKGLMVGLSGIGMHYASRLGNPNFTDQIPCHLKEKYLILIIVDLLEESLQKNRNCDRKANAKEAELSFNFCDLGIANGLLGIILFLCQLSKQNIHADRITVVLDGYVEYLLHQGNEDISGLHFPGNVHNPDSCLQWNYGDLAVAYTLYQAGKVTNNTGWKGIATKMALRTTAIKETENENAGIYSGTMGIAHLYNHFYQNTLNIEFKRAAEYWTDKTLSTANDEGLPCFSIPLTKDNEPEPGILKGLAGVGLVLISSIADFQPDWDGCLLMQHVEYPTNN